jgi:hypothetical protein
MKVHTKTRLLIASVLTLAAFGLSGVPVQSQSKPGAVRLQGGTDHSEFLPPVPDEMKAGSQLDENSVAKASSNTSNDWYRVPKWLAGTWPRQSVILDYDKDFKTGETHTNPVSQTDVSTSDYGYLPDSKGDVWDTAQRFSTIRSDYGKTNGISHVKSNKVLSASDNQITIESEGTLTIVDKKKNVILSTRQCEAIRTFSLLDDGGIRVESSQKDFDQDGHPLSLKRTEFTAHRSAPFDPSRGIADKPMVQLLAQFFMNKYWNDLVPGYYYQSTSFDSQ